MGLQNVGKFSHFGMAVLRRGVGVNGHWPFCVTKVGMDVVPKLFNIFVAKVQPSAPVFLQK